MTPLYFGDSASPLFGALTPPHAGRDRGHGVVICPPIAQEHVRSHWALRQVAAALGRAGFAALRFDWFGVGDSAGRVEEASVARWVEDVRRAAEELRDTAGVRKVSLCGLRLGATLAALAAPRVKPRALIAWEPITRGDVYLRDLRALHAGVLTDERRFWHRWPEHVRQAAGRVVPALVDPPPSRSDELVGFSFPAALAAEIGALQPPLWRDATAARIVVVGPGGDRATGDIAGSVEPAGRTVEVHGCDVRGRWDDPTQIEELLPPGDAPRVIAEALEAAS